MGRRLTRIDDAMAIISEIGVPGKVLEAIRLLLDEHADPSSVDATFRSDPQDYDDPERPEDIYAVASLFHRFALRRKDILGDLGHDPSWHMLLALLADEGARKLTSVSSLCIASGGPPTTALRHIAAMEKMGLIQRSSDPRDGRRFFLSLTEDTRSRLIDMLSRFCVPRPKSLVPQSRIYA